MPQASIVCTNVGKPVGMAEIAVETHRSRTRVTILAPNDTENRDITATANEATRPKTFVICSSPAPEGDRVGGVGGDHLGDPAHSAADLLCTT